MPVVYFVNQNDVKELTCYFISYWSSLLADLPLIREDLVINK